VYSYLWTLIPFGSVTWRVELGESFAAAMACGLVGLMVSRGSSMLIEGIEDLNNTISRNWENAICIVCGIVAGLLLGFDDFMWKESVVINRISVFDVPWLMLVAACLMRWIYAPQQRRYLYAAMFFFGLCFTIHQTMLLAAMGIEAVVVMGNPKLGRDLLLGNSLIYVLVMMASATGNLAAYDGLDEVFKAIFHVVGITSIGLCFWLTTSTKSLGTELKIAILLGIFWLLGAAFYFYEPLSGMTDPPMQWGYPRTVEGFFHAFTRGQYEKAHPTDIVHEKTRFIMQLGLLVNGLANSYSWVFLIVALLPFLFLWKMQRRERNWIIGLAAIYFCVGILLTIVMNTTPDRQAAEENKVFFTASHGIVAIMIGYGLALLSAYMATHYKRFRPMALMLGVVTLVPALTLLWDSVSTTFYGGTGLLDYVKVLLLFMGMVAAFALAALATNYFLKSRSSTPAPDDRFFSLMFGIAALLFLGFSIYLAFFARSNFGLTQIVDAMPKMFAPHQYSSPAIGALILVGAVVIFIGSVFVYRNRAPLVITLALFTLTPVYSVLTHWANGEERNHWFGYWFGHDMFTPPFEGPDGKFSYDPKLREQMMQDPVKAKLIYPEMDRHTILFGGTDPGRFCPTYMIFCESFVPAYCKPMDPNFDRRDVYLITQNALADDTYLDYLRAQYFRSAQIDPPFFREFLKLYGVPIVAALLGLCAIWIAMDFIRLNPRRNRNAIIIGSVWGIILIVIFANSKGDGFAGGVSRAGYNILDKPFTKFGAHVEAKRRAEGVYPPAEIYIPSSEDLSRSFTDYQDDFQRRYQEGRLMPGESAQTDDSGHLMIGGQVSVMMVNGLLCKVIFDHNPTNEFYVEESFPLEWMYPYETPYGIIMKINRQPLQSLSQEILDRDHEFWSKYSERFIGNWITYDTSVGDICTNFVEKVYLHHDYSTFKGDHKFIRDEDGQKAFSKLRDSQAGMYAWRLRLLIPNIPLTDPDFINYRPKTDVDLQQLMARYGTGFGKAVEQGMAGREVQQLYKEADFAFKQSFAFCPYSPETVVRYVNFLYQFQRFDDALLIAQTCKKLDPYNSQMDDIIDQIKSIQSQLSDRNKAVSSLQQMETEAREHPANIDNLISLGTAYYQLDQTDHAIETFESALTNSALTYNQAGSIVQFYSVLGPKYYDKLETALKKMVDLAPNMPEAHYDLAAMEVMHGETADALNHLRITMQLNAARMKTNSNAKNLLLTNLSDHRFDSIRNLPEYQKIISQ